MAGAMEMRESGSTRMNDGPFRLEPQEARIVERQDVRMLKTWGTLDFLEEPLVSDDRGRR